MRFQLKAFTSLFLALLFLALGFSGILLFFTPRGRMANWTGWTMLGLEKQGWQAIHTNIALVFLIIAGLHLFLNWTMFWGYIKKTRLEMLAAAILASGILFGTIKDFSPFDALMTLNNRIKDYWERVPVTAPVPHAEELSLGQLSDRMGLPVEQVAAALKQDGIAVENNTMSIAQLAEKNRLTPSDVYAAIRKHFPEAQPPGPGKGGSGQGKGGGFGPGKGQGRGMGRKMQG